MNQSDYQNQLRYSFSILQSMRMFFKQGLYCDIELIIKEKRYKTHKSILHVMSPIFRTKRIQNVRELVMNCKGIREESITKTFEFLYKGTVELRLEQIANVIKLAEMWQIEELKKYCYSYLEIIYRDNCEIIRKNYEIDDYLLNNFQKLTTHERFLEMSVDNLISLLSSDNLRVSSEEQAFEGLSQWIKHDWINRKNHLYSLMKCIRFPFCSVSFLLENVMSLCYESVEGCQLILDALKWHQMPQKRSILPLMNTKPRIDNRQILIIRNYYGMPVLIEWYSLLTNSWITLFKIDIHYRNFSTVMFKHSVLVFGGWDSEKNSTNKAFSFDLHSKNLRHLAPMIEKRHCSSAVIVNNRIFVIGGSVDNDELNSVEEYDYDKNIWKKVASMNIKRHEHASVVYKENIYVFGGRVGIDVINSVEVFNTKTNQWKILSPMKWKRRMFAAIVVENYIYCIGGGENISSGHNYVERYDPENDSWVEVSQALEEMSEYSAICYDRKIICFGCCHSKVIQEYDPEKDQWRIIDEIQNVIGNYNALIVE